MNHSQIDEAIYAAARMNWTKVAMVIARVGNAVFEGLPLTDEDCEQIAQRIETLVSKGKLSARGNIKNWRFSEVRLSKVEKES